MKKNIFHNSNKKDKIPTYKSVKNCVRPLWENQISEEEKGGGRGQGRPLALQDTRTSSIAVVAKSSITLAKDGRTGYWNGRENLETRTCVYGHLLSVTKYASTLKIPKRKSKHVSKMIKLAKVY